MVDVSYAQALASASAPQMRAQLRAPFLQLSRLYFSFGAWIRSSSKAKPTSSACMPSLERNDSTIGMEPPQPTTTGARPHSASRAFAAAEKVGAEVSNPTAGDPPSPVQLTVASEGRCCV